ncbi:HNH endonuclease signature motif containing protein [Catenulispora yoronensis]
MTTRTVIDAGDGGYCPPFATAKAWRRFRRKVVETAGCSIWIGAIGDDGYPRFHDPAYGDEDAGADRRSDIVRASRWRWWAEYGPIPAGRKVLHDCDVQLCVRLDHLLAGTQSQNLLMAAHRDRTARVAAWGTARRDAGDRRSKYEQSLAIRDAVVDAVAAGQRDRHALARIVAAVLDAGSPLAGQDALFDL